MDERVSLEQRALLVSFQKSAWPGTAPDKTADKDIQAARGNKAGTTRTTKWLVDEAEIKKVHKVLYRIDYPLGNQARRGAVG